MMKVCCLGSFRDADHWQRFLATIRIAFTVFCVGWYYGLQGPALPDLELLIGTNLQGVSVLLTVQGVGRVLGGLVLGYLYDRTNRYIPLMLSLALFGGAATALLPLSGHFSVFIVLCVIIGFSFGGINCGSNAKIASMWEKEGRQYMQFVHFSYAFGGILSPLVASPFLSKPYTVPTNLSKADNYSDVTTMPSDMTTAFHPDLNTTNDYELVGSEIYGKSRIFIPFAIAGGLMVAASFGLICYLCLYREPDTVHVTSVSLEKSDLVRDRVVLLPIRFKIILALLLFIVVLSYAPKEFAQQSYLMIFIIRQLGWSRPLGAVLTSILWTAFGSGRLLGIFLSKHFSPITMIYVSLTGMLIASIGQFCGSYFRIDGLIWTFVPLAGLSMSVFSPSLVIWINENLVAVSGKVASFIGLTTSLGILVCPLYLGFLIDTYTPMWYVYLQALEGLVTFTFFTILVVMVGFTSKVNFYLERVPILSTE